MSKSFVYYLTTLCAVGLASPTLTAAQTDSTGVAGAAAAINSQALEANASGQTNARERLRNEAESSARANTPSERRNKPSRNADQTFTENQLRAGAEANTHTGQREQRDWSQRGTLPNNRRGGNARDGRRGGPAGARFGDADRNADWRFVQRGGSWWYYGPNNRWMVRRGGQWNAYDRSGHTTGYRGQGQARHDGQGQPIQQSDYNAGVQAGQQRGDVRQTSAEQPMNQGQTMHQGQNDPRVGTTEWMCIDGRMRKVTVVSVTPSTMQGQIDRGESYQSQPAEVGGDQSGDRMSPPPVPSQERTPMQRDADLPAAPTAEEMERTTATDPGQPYTANRAEMPEMDEQRADDTDAESADSNNDREGNPTQPIEPTDLEALNSDDSTE